MKVLIRNRLISIEEAALKLNIHEVGGDNRGPWVDKFLASVGLPPGYAWCDAAQSFFETEAAGKKLPIASASVGNTYNTAKQLGWVVSVPGPGDLVCYNWEGAGPPFADHIGLVIKAVSAGSYWKLNTIEGNTSSGNAGSQSNGDGLYARTRVITKSMVGFVRIPGDVDLAPVKSKPTPKKATKKVTKPQPEIVKAEAKTEAAAKQKPTTKKAPEEISENGKGQNG